MAGTGMSRIIVAPTLALALLGAACGGASDNGASSSSSGFEPGSGEGSAAAGGVGSGDVTSSSSNGAPPGSASRSGAGGPGGADAGTGGAGGGTGGGKGAASPRSTYKGEIGVTKDTITLGALVIKSGPTAVVAKNLEVGFRAGLAEINEKGGIHGRKLEAIFGDDGDDNASVALASTKAMQNKVFGMTIFSSQTQFALYSYIEANRIPNIYNTLGRGIAQKLRYEFPAMTTFETSAEILPSFIVKTFKGKSKVAVIMEDTASWNPVLESFKRRAAQAGLQVVLVQRISPSPNSCFNEVTKAQGSGAQVVFAGVGALTIGCLLRDAQAANYHPDWTGFGFVANVVNAAAGCRTEGIMTLSQFHTLSDPQGARYSAAMRNYAPSDPDAAEDDVGALGWGNAQVWIEALRRAGPNPTRAGFVAAMETMRNFDPGWYGPMTFGPGDRFGSRKVLPIQVRNCRWVTIENVWRDRF